MVNTFGALEAGGTKFICAIGTEEGKLVRTARIPTTHPSETLQKTIAFFQSGPEPIERLGVGCFGPLDLNPRSESFGTITQTPKPGWSNTAVQPVLENTLSVQVRIDTDVNTAALGEAHWGAGQGVSNLLYLTIGTGIGGGVLIDGRPVHGLVHPEMGHILLPNHPEAGFHGICPFHSDCFEGLASGPAIAARWGSSAEDLPENHPAWDIEAQFIAQALHAYVLTLSPERIILGGGVMKQAHLFPRIRRGLLASLNGYVQADGLLDQTDQYVVPPALGDRAGILGALRLAIAD